MGFLIAMFETQVLLTDFASVAIDDGDFDITDWTFLISLRLL